MPALIPPKSPSPALPPLQKFQKYTGKAPQVPKHERKLQATERKRARLDPEQPSVAEQIAKKAEEPSEREEQPQLRHGGQANYAGLGGGGVVSSVTDLRKRLSEKLQQMRENRGGGGKEASAREPRQKQPKHQVGGKERGVRGYLR